MWRNVYLVDCSNCGAELVFRDLTSHVVSLPKDSRCSDCGHLLRPTGEVALEALCVYCSHVKIYPRLVPRPRCENCGLVMSEDTESDIVGITKMVSAGVKTGDRDTLLMVGVAVVGVLLLFSVIAGWWK